MNDDEVIQEHEAQEGACVWPYPEHDYEITYEDAEIWQGTCRRCGAEGATVK